MSQLEHEAIALTRPSYHVRPSTIHGLGLFAAAFIPADTHIGDYEGPIVIREEDDGDHVLWVHPNDGPSYGIEGRNALRYVNHAATPNAVFYDHQLFALRDILPGEEITHHYGDDWHDLT